MAVKYVKDFSFPAAGGFHSGSVQRYAKGGHVTKMPAKAKASAKGMPARAKPNAPAKGAPKMESKPSRGKRQGYERGGPVMEIEPLERTLARDAAMTERGAMRRDMMGRPGMRGMARRPVSRMKVPSPIRQPAMTPFDLEEAPYMPVFKKGGAVKGKKIAKVMREYKKGELHSGSKKGPKVTNPKQAMAIALSESRRMKKADGGEVNDMRARLRDRLGGQFTQKEYEYMLKNPMRMREALGSQFTQKEYENAVKEASKPKKKADGGEVFSDENLAYGNKKGPYRGSPKKGRELGRRDRMQRARDQRALDKARHAEKYAPGLSLDMPDEPMSRYEKGGSVKKAVHKHEKTMHPGKPLTKLSRGGVPSYGRKPMYGGGKC
jgi:hypothetical protein